MKAQRTEKLNPNLINPESILGCEIHAIRNIYHPETEQPLNTFFSAKCEGTKVDIGNNPTNDNWEVNRILEFPIVKGNDYLIIRAKDMSSGMMSDSDNDMMVVVDLKDLRDQQLHENTYR